MLLLFLGLILELLSVLTDSKAERKAHPPRKARNSSSCEKLQGHLPMPRLLHFRPVHGDYTIGADMAARSATHAGFLVDQNREVITFAVHFLRHSD